MKRVICMLLVLVMCMVLPCTAFATSSPGGSVPTTTPQTGDASAINVWIMVMVLALIALVVVLLFSRKMLKK